MKHDSNSYLAWGGKNEDSEHLQQLKSMHTQATKTMEDVVSPMPILKALVDAGRNSASSPWPRILFDMPFMRMNPSPEAGKDVSNAFDNEPPASLELVDTPGLDEITLLPDLKRVVQDCMEGAQASVCLVAPRR